MNTVWERVANRQRTDIRDRKVVSKNGLTPHGSLRSIFGRWNFGSGHLTHLVAEEKRGA